MKRLGIGLIFVGVCFGPARADRVQVYSVQGFTCEGCEAEVAPLLKKLKGVKKWTFDRKTYEYTLTLADDVPDKVVIDAFDRQGYRAIVGAGQGVGPDAYKPAPYPEGSDVSIVTEKGDAVGALERFRVEGKYTVLDFYADWCGPCRDVDRQLHVVLKDRNDVAVRKFNVVSFDSPLAKELDGRGRLGSPEGGPASRFPSDERSPTRSCWEIKVSGTSTFNSEPARGTPCWEPPWVAVSERSTPS